LDRHAVTVNPQVEALAVAPAVAAYSRLVERIVVIGSSGAGKSTLARALARRLCLPRLELDSIRHQPGWTELPDPEFRARVAAMTARPRWVIDGNYHVVRDVVWAAADTVVWLDLSRSLVTLRVIRRTLGRLIARRELWNGNRERLRMALSWDPQRSIIRWAWVQHPVIRAGHQAAIGEPGHAHLAVHRLRSPTDVRAFVDAVPETTRGPAGA
jgi:adenylate kinase family enzyme